MNAWLMMGCAILFEVGGTTALKLSDGLSRLAPSLAVVALYAASFACLAFALRRIELGVAYAVWSGLGTAAIALIGIVLFKEQAGTLKLVSLGLVIAGVIGLNLAEAGR